MTKPTKSRREDSDQSRHPSTKADQCSLRMKKQVLPKLRLIRSCGCPVLSESSLGGCDCWFCHDVAEIFSVSVKHLLA